MEKTFYKSPDGKLIDSVSTIMSRVRATEFNGSNAMVKYPQVPMTEYPQEPASDPQEHFCKSVCGRIAGGLIHDTPVKDLREVKRWLDDHIENRDASPPPPRFKPF